jgi:N-acetyl-gamma-glutamyl-phosphate/LysW-gamma-L-alpha-aminoadipyl-6-phosphate reductase
MSLISAGVVGATGYAGAELIRHLLAHGRVELRAVVSRSRAGTAVSQVFPALHGFTDLVFEAFDAARLADLDVVFLATPHGAAAPLVQALERAGAKRIIDLSADHRHADGWVYGQAEWHASQLPGAKRIAVPGCFATAISLSLAPFVAGAHIAGPVQCVAATGSTGSGASPSITTHHPERLVNLKAYKVLGHQHTPEVTTFLRGLGAFERLDFVPLSAPIDRGILSTCFLPLTQPMDTASLQAIVTKAYAGHPMVRVLDRASPELRHVRGTGLCDISVCSEGGAAVVIAAIDNLGKGAAAQAIQCLNLSLDWPVQTDNNQPAILP